jgi:hypothetical protein
MSENQSEEIEQSAPAEEPEVEGFGVINTTRSNIKSGHGRPSLVMSMGLGASDFGMKAKAPERPKGRVGDSGVAGSDTGEPG